MRTVALLTVTLLLAFVLPLRADAQTSRWNSEETVKQATELVTNAMNSMAPRGSGTAVVRGTLDRGPDTQAGQGENYAHFLRFKFSGDLSMSELHGYDPVAGPSKDSGVVRLWDGKRRYYWCPSTRMLSMYGAASLEFDNWQDFRPSAITSDSGTLDERVRAVLAHFQCEIKHGDDGAVRLVVHLDSGDPKWTLDSGSATYVFDPTRGHALVEYNAEGLGITSESRSNPFLLSIRWEYQRTDHGWYPRKRTSECEDRDAVSGSWSKQRTEVEVLTFDANPQFGDDDFTLEGLHIPRDALVYDVKTRIWTRRGEPPVDLSEVLTALNASDSVDTPESTSAALQPPAPAVPFRTGEPPAPRVPGPGTAVRRLSTQCLMLICLAAVVVLVATLCLRARSRHL